MGSSWKLVLVFAVLFLIGGVSGSVITYAVLRRQMPQNITRNFHGWTENLIQRLQRIGKLTPEQATKIRPRVESAVKQMQAIQIQAMLQGSDAFDAALAEIETELNPDQQKRLESFRERRRAKIQEGISRRQEQQ
jgi:predicted PurR-regulated permease PerM